MDKKLITQKGIEELLKSGSKNLTVSNNTIITLLAADLIRKNGIILNYADSIYENKISTSEGQRENPMLDFLHHWRNIYCHR